MALREVGMYAWTVPAVKDPTGSMMKIMKRTLTAVCQVYFQKEEQEERKADEGLEEYEKQIKAMSRHADLRCRSVRGYPTYLETRFMLKYSLRCQILPNSPSNTIFRKPDRPQVSTAMSRSSIAAMESKSPQQKLGSCGAMIKILKSVCSLGVALLSKYKVVR